MEVLPAGRTPPILANSHLTDQERCPLIIGTAITCQITHIIGCSSLDELCQYWLGDILMNRMLMLTIGWSFAETDEGCVLLTDLGDSNGGEHRPIVEYDDRQRT
jgi:hypothetical protein